MKVLNFGSLNIDYVYKVDHMIREGETLSSSGMEVFLGGKGFNQSVALVKAGVPVYHAGMIGEEGKIFLDACEEYGISSKFIKTIEGKNGHTIIQVDKNGQNCIMLYGGSNRSLTKDFIDEVLSYFGEEDYILLQNEVNHLDYIIEKAYERGIKIVLNPSPLDSYLETCDLNKITYFMMNEIEGEQITGEKEANKILDKMMQMYPESKVILTLGSAGSLYQDKENFFEQGIFKTKVVDTTAAGDTFTGYFVSAIISGKSIPDALKMSAMAASITVSREGASPSIPTLDEVKEKLNTHELGKLEILR
ncbi:ribokinase [Sporanaerobium hydrogeniformans]|uniref:Ribokinase n=1 Tax=Sporanaerobium hydrogeniformans TaxID=3072179 RepID=A0AC61D937_9FIRM|nr:ribokinase [Sporanaerobium hydrogeniformans]PHV69537.1 ribokinase [Sporanaerobium hydrogeniformans]